jgi:hypothetical protein
MSGSVVVGFLYMPKTKLLCTLSMDISRLLVCFAIVYWMLGCVS